MKHFITIILCMATLLTDASAAIRTDTVIINNGVRKIFGILSRPSSEPEGKMPIAIISHGFNGTHDYGRNYFEPLAEAGYMCYAFDYPCGSVNSHFDNNTTNMSVIDERDDLIAVIDYFRDCGFADPDRVAVIGESQGGLVANLAASAIPEKIDRLVLCFAALGIPEEYNALYKTEDDIPSMTYVWKVPLGHRFFKELRNLRPYDFSVYDRPVLLIHGDKDPVVPLASSERALFSYPCARLVIIEGAGHGFNSTQFNISISHIKRHLLKTDITN